ncbi:MAG: DUF2065 domain-containing protein [Thiomonas sp.]|jgi:uncharacterized protein YjeT (DUF2065 family)|uniref:DUF2065 domain-containing protein n=2 Tax=Thiomonas TaxID=32012 RepID=A0A8I1SW21_THIA3|nr:MULTISPECIES: DUF2065 domain-containing protein [Thiomonas]MDE1979209.1 DUF2065 domain-containing protein [Betaproteobacteria bacterium]OYV31191.1 MAG: DUF2065 domain-containing protein [Thiomonas sp. 20-64-9]OZB73718.1 MAG: DUF2065 domain-containing protein [Thiomonas sp. 14-64-326]MBN8744937.1 DUF2065 domain-containing protein [Thiomonas arsenitoxydans]MBN8777272.1 DUF2065 domain-containing protein [Thiomonas arsenitoxydans]
MQNVLLLAIGMVLVIEGLMPLFFPRQWRDMFRQIMALTDGQLRFVGLIAVAIGLLLVFLLK